MDSAPAKFTPKCRIDHLAEGYRFTFTCERCEHSYTTPALLAESLRQTLALAERDARFHFNRCQRCGRWVCDAHYNENWMMCTDCAPRICGQCGTALGNADQFCTVCGASQYEKADGKDEIG